ncbi:Ig-like domain-containing protein [Deinococcus aestuarii]|uniref:Ig-like domain-containing protein n=1 Tax=Deinococcus aestuarii TaxID=2774531 RepID=UPI001C0BF699
MTPNLTTGASTTWVPSGQPLTITAAAPDPEGVAKVEFFAFPDDPRSPARKIGEATGAPYSVVWDDTPVSDLNTMQRYTVSAVATDNTGVRGSAGVSLGFSLP